MRHRLSSIWLSLVLLIGVLGGAPGCGEDEDAPESCDPAAPECDEGLVCIPDEADGSVGTCGEAPACASEAPSCPTGLVCQPPLDADGEALCVNPCDPEDGEACGDGATCDAIQHDCATYPELCEDLPTGTTHALLYTCVEPVVLRGVVTDGVTTEPIEGAHVAMKSPAGAVVSDVVVTGEDGAYEVTVPVGRDSDGAPIESGFSVVAGAQGYQVFPYGIRPALPIDAAGAVAEDGVWVVDDPTTAISLLPLEGDTTSLGSIAGAIEGEHVNGVLVVAEGGDVPSPFGMSDLDGDFVVFNVPAGSYSVVGYKTGLQIDGVTVSVEAGTPTEDVTLSVADRPTYTVEGQVNIVNAPGGSMTSVVLVPEPVFQEEVARGEVPFGLRAPEPGLSPSITGAFSIPGVPDGEYVVLAAFENDDLVRDPDPSIGGTQIVHISVPADAEGEIVALASSFKITEALEVVSPGADGPEAVSGQDLVLEWADDSSEDWFEVEVYDAFGALVWARDDVPKVSGEETVTVTYGGDPLAPGMYYQFKATSFKDKSGPISVTEGLRGVFYVPVTE